MSASWRVSLPCTREEAERIAADSPERERDPPRVLTVSEPDPKRPDEWRFDAYFEEQPDDAAFAWLRTLAPSAAAAEPLVEELGDQDWVTMSQQGLEPIRAGRFFVHTPAHRHVVPTDAVGLQIDAGRAFGTGQHETTTGCLLALERLGREGATFDNILDLGTGTGLLAFAALRLWPAARVAASDIDPVAIEVAAENAAVNGVPVGAARGELELVVAVGLDHERLRERAPYDLILANILAGPLIDLAPAIAEAMEPGGRLILAGLLAAQAEQVAAAYRAQGLEAAFTVERVDWPTLAMRKSKALASR